MTRGPIFTIGHSNHELGKFMDLLHASSVGLVADVRSIPRSRANPQFEADALARALAAEGVRYEHIQELGGRRGRAALGPSPNEGWEVVAFRNYADYALTPLFEQGLSRLLDLGARHVSAVMCAEALYWRCHRRIVVDYLLCRGREVRHILGNGRLVPAELTPFARVRQDGKVVYPPARARAETLPSSRRAGRSVAANPK
jgi:uncharacterized protein (DUF488 family)